MIVLMLLMYADAAVMAKQKRPISQESFEWMIEIEPLIFQALVIKVEVILVTPKQLYGLINDTVQLPVTEVTMKIEKIIAGEYEGDEIVIVLPEGRTERATWQRAGRSRMTVNVGDQAIVAFELDSWGTGINILDPEGRFFRVEGAELVPYREEFYLDVDKPLEVMEKKAKEREKSRVIKTIPDELIPGVKEFVTDFWAKRQKNQIERLPYLHPGDAFKDIRVGEPYPHYKLHMDILYGLEDHGNFEDALEIIHWRVPIYIGDEIRPRTLFFFRADDDNKWQRVGQGSDAQHIYQARERWPVESGYRHAQLFCTIPKIGLIMLELDDEIQFFFYFDEGGERIFGISKGEDGYYPAFSKDHFMNIVKSTEKYNR